MRSWFVLLIAMFIIVCLVQLVPTAPPEEEAGTEPPGTPFTIPECQPASGVTFKIQKTGEYLVELIASGLLPGDSPYIYYWTVDDMPVAGFPGNDVDERGEFFSDLNWSEWNVDILKPPEGQSSATWEFRLVHSRGVECAEITLP